MWLTITIAGQVRRTELSGQRIVIGRSRACDVVIDDPEVSRRHLTVEPHGAHRALVRDLGSSNGTRLNGTSITGAVLVGPGERVQIGDATLSIELPQPAAPPAAPPSVAVGDTAVAAQIAPPPPAQRPNDPGARRHGDRRVVWAVLAALALGLPTAVAVLIAGSQADQPLTVEDIVERAASATVIVVTDDGQGSGWVYDADRGLIVTNHHVIGRAEGLSIGVDGQTREATLVGTAPCEDLAVLRVSDRGGLESLELGDQREVRLGQPVVALGYPDTGSMRADLVATTGVVSIVRTSLTDGFDVPDYPNILQTDAAINPGNSGGPLLDLTGRLVGVNAAGRTLGSDGRIVQGQSFAIGVDRVAQIVPDLVDGRSHAWTGAAIETPTDAGDLARRGLPLVDGLILDGAIPGTRAATTPLGTTTAVVTAIDDRPMDGSLPAYCEVVGDRRRGDRATFTLVGTDGEPPMAVEVGFE